MLLGTTALWSGCESSDSPIPDEGESRVPITFSAGESLSRGTPVSAYSMSEFPLKGYVVDSYEYMDVTVKRRSDGSWGTDQPYYWPPRGEPMQFCAYYGVPAEDFFLVNYWVNNPQQQTYYYKVKSDVKEQKDLIYALSEVCNYHSTPQQSVKLTFRHILAWVKINLIGDASNVSSIEFRNLWSSGVFVPDKMTWELTGPWGGDAEKSSYVIPVEDGAIAEVNRNLFVIPQLTPGDAVIAINRRDGTSAEQPFSWHTFFMDANNNVNITLAE